MSVGPVAPGRYAFFEEFGEGQRIGVIIWGEVTADALECLQTFIDRQKRLLASPLLRVDVSGTPKP